MTTIRLCVRARLAAGCALEATPAQAHYLGTVMRRAAGEELRLFNGCDGEWSARLEDIRRDRASLLPLAQLRPQEREPDIWLAFALLKRHATDLVVEKATELGATRLLPVITARTNAERVNLARLAAIATEAAEQCERLTVPPVDPPARLEDLLSGWPPNRRLVAALERSDAAPIGAAAGGLLVGPEGGFTATELDALQRHPFVVPATLGRRILRAETASIAGLALLQALAEHH
jgi:16S rRNA (uracil1498-N3)-methyltransferase